MVSGNTMDEHKSTVKLDWEKFDAAENLETLDNIITESVLMLTSMGDSQATSPNATTPQSEACERFWLETFVEPAYCKMEKHVLSLNDLAFIALCHTRAVRDEDVRKWGRSLMVIEPFTDRHEALRLFHAKILCCIRELGDFADDILKIMPSLVKRLAGIIVYCKGESTTRVQKDLDVTLFAESASAYSTLLQEAKQRLPAVYDLNEDSQDDDPEREEEEDKNQKKKQNKDEDDLDELVAASMNTRSRVDPDLPFWDHRRPENRGKIANYLPQRFDMYRFVTDCSRLCYWSSCIATIRSSHGDCVYPAKQLKRVTDWSIRTVFTTIAQRAKSQVISETYQVFEKLYLATRCPLGSRDSFNRENMGIRESHETGLIATSEIGLKAHTYYVKQAEEGPDLVFAKPLDQARQHETFDAWVWTLWDRIAKQADIEWLAHWFIIADEFPLRRWDPINTLNSFNAWRPWRNETRRPLVFWIGNTYYIQAVKPEFVDRVQPADDLSDWNEVFADDAFELWHTKDCLEAISCWCALIVSRHQGTIQRGKSIKDLVSDLVLNPTTEDEIPIEENDEDKLRRLLTKPFDW